MGESIPDGVSQIILVNSVSIDINGLELISVVGVYCSNLQIRQNLISVGEIGVYLFETTNTLFSGNTVCNNEWSGIIIRNSVNCSLVNNDFNNNGLGISIDSSTGINLSGNTICNNEWSGIIIRDSINCTLVSNNVNNNNEGIFLFNSSFNTLSGNQVTNNSVIGIYLDLSRKNIITDNKLVNNGFFVWGTQVEDYLQQLVMNNSVNGKALVYWQNVMGETIADGVCQVILVNSDSITIQGQELISVVGVHCLHLQIRQNIISAGEIGIYLSETSNTLLSGNIVKNHNEFGISLIESPHCILVDNTITNNIYGGIKIERSGNSTLTRNIVTNNLEYGIRLSDSGSSKLVWNIVNENNGIGILIISEGNNSIYGNTLTNNTGYGVQLLSSTDNIVHWNNFLYNNPGPSTQAFDDGNNNNFTHNYWSNWSSLDNDADGIVDLPYPISGEANNQDSSPLVTPYVPPHPPTNDFPRVIFSVGLLLVLISLIIFFIVKQRAIKP
jgi:parallel beta-helix repeat protein